MLVSQFSLYIPNLGILVLGNLTYCYLTLESFTLGNLNDGNPSMNIYQWVVLT